MIKTGNFLPPDRPAQGMRADEILQKGSGIDMKADIGEIICQCRQNGKMTQEEFASRLGVTPQAVSKWERGIGLPDLSLVRGICQILDVSANTLLGLAEGKVVENANVLMEQEIKNNLFAEPLLLRFGEGLIPCVIAGLETDYVNRQRKRLAQDWGILLPVLRMKDHVGLERDVYQILSYDKILWEGRAKEKEPEDEKAFREMIDRVALECREHYAEILNKHLVKILVDNVSEFFPGIAEGLVPEKISYLRIQRRMQDMLRKGEPIRDIVHILEGLEEEPEGKGK